MSSRVDWLPYSLVERRALVVSFSEKIGEYAAELGLTQAEIDRIHEVCDAIRFAIDIVDNSKTTMKALVTWRDQILSGERVGATLAPRVFFDNTAAPAGTSASMIREFRQFVNRIKSSSGFSRAIGRDLGILPPNHAKTPLRELRPQLKVTAMVGFNVKIACEKKGMTALAIEYRRKGEENWQNIAFLTRLPETLFIQPAVNGVPETIEVRAWFIKDNKTVGDPSNPVVVTIFGL